MNILNKAYFFYMFWKLFPKIQNNLERNIRNEKPPNQNINN